MVLGRLLLAASGGGGEEGVHGASPRRGPTDLAPDDRINEPEPNPPRGCPRLTPPSPPPASAVPFTFEELVAFCGILLIFWIVGKCVERLGLPAVRLPPAHRSPPLYTENISARAPVILRSARADRSSNRRTPTN